MLICRNCFTDIELQAEVENEGSSNEKGCEVCGGNGKVIDIDHFSDFFDSLIRLFKKDESSTYTLIDAIQSKWNIFSVKIFAENILSYIISLKHIDININDTVSFVDEIQSDIDIWKRIKENLTKRYRFFTGSDDIDSRNLISFDFEAPYYRISNCGIIQLKPGDILYRARITEAGKEQLTPEEMSCPPNNKAVAGRANPLGIPYLYLCQDIKTTYYEVRAGYLDKISVGSFKVQRNLNIVNFDFQLSPYLVYVDGGDSELKKQVIKYEFLKEIRDDLSKPLTRYDTELEYVPTQWICEYCKINGADGISFNSSLDKEGVNYVLFNQDDVRCTNVTSHTIEKIDIIAS